MDRTCWKLEFTSNVSKFKTYIKELSKLFVPTSSNSVIPTSCSPTLEESKSDSNSFNLIFCRSEILSRIVNFSSIFFICNTSSE